MRLDRGSFFEVLRLGGLLHLFLEFFDKFMATAFKIEAKFAEVLFIFFGSNSTDFDTRSETEIGVKSFLAIVRLIVIWKNFTEDAKSFLDSTFAVKGADVGRFVILRSAREANIRDFGFHVDTNVGNGLVIAQKDVPLWHVAFDHLGFKEKGVHFSVDYNPIGVSNFADESLSLRIFLGVMKILTDAIL